MEGIKHDEGKVRTDLLAWDAIDECAKVMTYGAAKYDDRNYYGLPQSRLYGAVIRHLIAWWLRKGPDPETGQSHLAHAMAGCMMLLEKELNQLGADDRPRVPVRTTAADTTSHWTDAPTAEDFEPRYAQYDGDFPSNGAHVRDGAATELGRKLGYQRCDKSDTDYEGNPR